MKVIVQKQNGRHKVSNLAQLAPIELQICWNDHSDTPNILKMKMAAILFQDAQHAPISNSNFAWSEGPL